MTTFFIKHVVCNQHSFLAREQLQGYNYQWFKWWLPFST
jgi:hypothetical protein